MKSLCCLPETNIMLCVIMSHFKKPLWKSPPPPKEIAQGNKIVCGRDRVQIL